MSKGIKETIKAKGQNILNVYITAGYPHLDSTVEIVNTLADAGVDLIELGMPYSDPLADGETIQKSSQLALQNGLTLEILFQQVAAIREQTDIPIIAMGYYNQLLQYGVERFLAKANETGIQGLIIPDLPMYVYERDYQDLFQQYNIEMSFLVTPLTSDDRVRKAAKLSSGFLYVVSQTSITGKTGDISQEQIDYFNKINALRGDTPTLIGFGIHDSHTYQQACRYSQGAIIGSAFIRAIDADHISSSVTQFINSIR